jgi:Glycosyl hydrolase family 71
MRIPGRNVFSWYLVYHYTYDAYNPPIGSQTSINNFKKEILEAQGSGLDGWELSLINRTDLYATTYNIFRAAEQIYQADTTKAPFWLFISPDLYPGAASGTFTDGNGVNQGNMLLYFLQQFQNSTNYYKINGKPVMGSFLGPDDGSNQTALTNDVFNPMGGAGSVFYVPAVQGTGGWTTDGLHMTPWALANIGAVRHWTGDQPQNNIGGQNSIANVCAVNGKPIACGVETATEYWDTHSGNAFYFERNGGEGSAAEWVNAIGLAPIFISETTWNDFAEAYSAWVDIPNIPTIVSGYPYDFLLMPHRGCCVQRIYYAQWYVTGVQPTITTDLLIAFYRTMPWQGETAPPTINWLQNPIDVNYVQTFLTAPAILSVSSGGNVNNYSMAAGVNSIRNPFTPGTQTFSLIRGGVTIASVTGAPIKAPLQQNNAHHATCYASPGVHYP